MLMGGDTNTNKSAGYALGSSLTLRGEALGAYVANSALNWSDRHVMDNFEMVETNKRVPTDTK
jgi:hypothetical protein